MERLAKLSSFDFGDEVEARSANLIGEAAAIGTALSPVERLVTFHYPISDSSWADRSQGLRTVNPVLLDFNRSGRDREDDGFQAIIGRSAAISAVLDLVRTVGPTDSTVLIEGETGTGKELIAEAIHTHSSRKARPLIKLNCAAIPLGLLESELFGHEKGAFTGAVSRKIGRFEAANGGTLFLDEIGDIPLELQAKLLRVLQEGEFERLGSTQTQRVSVRLIAATNANLWNLVREKRFRSDLYYRVNVFPISLPPLRERREDIPILVRHFVAKYAARMHRRIDQIPDTTMDRLALHDWPGNIRELQNFIERSVILSSGSTLRVLSLEQRAEVQTATAAPPTTLRATERDLICRTLRETNGLIDGPRGAAVRLGIKRTTLYARMNKLGISRKAECVAE